MEWAQKCFRQIEANQNVLHAYVHRFSALALIALRALRRISRASALRRAHYACMAETKTTARMRVPNTLGYLRTRTYSDKND